MQEVLRWQEPKGMSAEQLLDEHQNVLWILEKIRNESGSVANFMREVPKILSRSQKDHLVRIIFSNRRVILAWEKCDTFKNIGGFICSLRLAL